MAFSTALLGQSCSRARCEQAGAGAGAGTPPLASKGASVPSQGIGNWPPGSVPADPPPVMRTRPKRALLIPSLYPWLYWEQFRLQQTKLPPLFSSYFHLGPNPSPFPSPSSFLFFSVCLRLTLIQFRHHPYFSVCMWGSWRGRKKRDLGTKALLSSSKFQAAAASLAVWCFSCLWVLGNIFALYCNGIRGQMLTVNGTRDYQPLA